jgi:hypothetical protein
VRLEAVGLDDEALLGPAEVGLDVAEALVHERPGKVLGIEEGEEQALELGPRARRSDALRFEHPADRRRAGASRVAVDEVLERGRAAEPERLRALARAGELVLVEDAGEVQERAGWGGDRDALVLVALVLRQHPTPRAQSRALSQLPRRLDLDVAPITLEHAPEGSRAAAPQSGPLAAGQDAGHPDRVARQSPMAHGIDAAVERQQATALKAVVDGIEGKTERDELVARDDAMLPRRERGDCPIAGMGVTLTVYFRHNVTRVSHVVHRRRRGYARPHGRCRP